MKLLPMTPANPDETHAEAARQMFSMYRAYVDAGFDKRQAMDIVLEILRASMAAQQPPKRPR